MTSLLLKWFRPLARGRGGEQCMGDGMDGWRRPQHEALSSSEMTRELTEEFSSQLILFPVTLMELKSKKLTDREYETLGLF